jgi:hypothetical protein
MAFFILPQFKKRGHASDVETMGYCPATTDQRLVEQPVV